MHRVMAGFSDSCVREAERAWGAVGQFPASYGRWKNGPSTAQRLQRGCLGWLLFGVVYLFLPVMVFLAVETVLVTWAVLLTVIAVVAVGVGHLGHRASKDAAS